MWNLLNYLQLKDFGKGQKKGADASPYVLLCVCVCVCVCVCMYVCAVASVVSTSA